MERVMGIEPTTSCLGSRHSTTELHPLSSTALRGRACAHLRGQRFGVSRKFWERALPIDRGSARWPSLLPGRPREGRRCSLRETA